MTLWLAVAAVLVGTLVARRRPEIVLTTAAIVVPSGSFHPALRIGTPIGQLTPFMAVTLVIGFAYVATTPGALSAGIRSAPGLVGAATILAGGIAGVAAWDAAPAYWVINGGLVLVLVSAMLARRYTEAPQSVEAAVVAGGVLLAASVLVEEVLGQHIGWSPFDPLPVDFPVFRPSGLAGNGLLAAATLAVVLAVVVTGAARTPIKLACAAAMALGVFATLSRSAAIAAAVALAVFVVRRPRWGPAFRLARGTVLVFGLPGLVALYLWKADAIRERLGGVSLQNVSDGSRVRSAQLAFAEFWAHPVFGLGLGGFKRFGLSLYGSGARAAAVADNMYLTFLAECGLIGVCVFTAVALVLLGRSRERRGRLLPVAVVGLVSVFFDSLFHDCMLYLFAVALLLAFPPPLDDSARSAVPAGAWSGQLRRHLRLEPDQRAGRNR